MQRLVKKFGFNKSCDAPFFRVQNLLLCRVQVVRAFLVGGLYQN